MTGEEFIAHVISDGSIIGISVGSRLESLDFSPPLSYVDESTGRRGSRVLRRDYGLFEVTYGGSPDWTSRALSLELHRLAHLPDLRDEVREKMGIHFEPFTKWADVQREFERIPGSSTLQVLDGDGEYRIFQNRSVGVSVHVIDDTDAIRGDFPGYGDVWGMAITSPRFMQ